MELALWQFLVALLVSFLGGLIAGRYELRSNSSQLKGKYASRIFSKSSLRTQLKLTMCVRTDLKMGKGKLAAQCGHATMGIYELLNANEDDRRVIGRWKLWGQKKIVVKIKGLDEMHSIRDKAKALGLPTHIVFDAGHTQVKSGSATVLAVLGSDDDLKEITGHLKLL